MGSHSKGSSCFEELVSMAIPILKEAEFRSPRLGRGAKPKIPDWFLGLIVFIAVAKQKKSKSAMYRYLSDAQTRTLLLRLTGEKHFPARSTFFDRYRRAHILFEEAIKVQGEKSIRDGIVDPKHLAIDKSNIKSKGRPYHKSDRKAGKRPTGKGIDFEAGWGYSKLHNWTYGYSFEVVVSCGKGKQTFPLLASAHSANTSELRTAMKKIEHLPRKVKTLSADAGYDSNELAESVMYDENGKPTGRKFLCPGNPRNKRPIKKGSHQSAKQIRSRELREQRLKDLKSKTNQRIYQQRSRKIEPFNSWFKELFGLDKAWHRGLANNQTQLLAALFCYQLLVRWNYRKRKNNAQVKAILDKL
jgi:hypothetical protein